MKFCDANFPWYLINVFFDAFLDYSKCPDDIIIIIIIIITITIYGNRTEWSTINGVIG